MHRQWDRQNPSLLALTSGKSHPLGRGLSRPDPLGPPQERRRCQTSTVPEVVASVLAPQNHRHRLMRSPSTASMHNGDLSGDVHRVRHVGGLRRRVPAALQERKGRARRKMSTMSTELAVASDTCTTCTHTVLDTVGMGSTDFMSVDGIIAKRPSTYVDIVFPFLVLLLPLGHVLLDL